MNETIDLEYDIDAAISSIGDAEKPHEDTEPKDQEPKEIVNEKAVATQCDKEREVIYDDIFIASADGMLVSIDRRDSISLFDRRIEVKSCVVYVCRRYH